MRQRKTLSDEERARKRAEDREYARQAVERLRSSEGWQQWLRTRASFPTRSIGNQLLIAMQRPSATHVAGFRHWLKLGYCVQKGQKAIRIWAPMPPSQAKLEAWRAAGSNPEDRPRTGFKLTAVFAQDQVAELPPPAVPAPLSCPIRELEGEDLAPAMPMLVALAREIGSVVALALIDGGARGYYEPASKKIVIDESQAVNSQVATLVHELGHALVRAERQDNDPKLDYASEELVVESVAFTVIRSSLGIDADASSIPYLAAWAESSDLRVIEQTAGLIDRIARRIEHALAPDPALAEATGETLAVAA